jgi:ABC-type dipeptide/oligopeptide/nickel transport system permease component
VVFVVAATIVVLTLIVDLAYGFLDPRIRLRGSDAA